MNTMLYAAFCGCGKTFLCKSNLLKYKEIECWEYRKGNFPTNYINDVLAQIGKVENIFVGTDPVILKELYKHGINIHLVYPEICLKEEYMKRYIKRNDSNDFIGWIYKEWENLITELSKQGCCNHIILSSGEYLEKYI